MTTITTRSGKGSPLSNAEMDANLTGLNDDKVETSGDSMTGDLSFGDNNKVILGSGNDLKLYHDGSDSYVDDTGTGRLRLRGAADIILAHPTNGETYATFSSNGANTFYYDNTARLATSSTGIDITGSITTDGLTSDGVATVRVTSAGATAEAFNAYNTGSGNNTQARFYLGASEYNTAGRGLRIDAGRDSGADGIATFYAVDQAEHSDYEAIKILTDGGVTLSHLGSNKLATSSTGIDITGIADASTLFRFGTDNSEIANNYLRFKSSGTGFFDHNTVGQAFNFRVSASSSLDTTPLVVNSTGIDVTGTVTADDITLSDASTPTLTITDTTNTVTNIIKADNSVGTVGTSTAHDLYIQSNNAVRQRVRSNGDISFYNDAASSQDLYWDASTSRLGLGTTAPATDLHIKNSGSVQLLLESGSSSQGILLFGDASDLNVGSVSYNHSVNSMSFETDDTERMSISSTGAINHYGDSINAQTSAAYYIRNRVNGGSLNLGVETTAGSLYYPVVMNGTSDILVFNNAEGEMARFTTDGKLGLGISSPAKKLDVGAIAYAGNQSGGIRIADTGGNWSMGVSARSDGSGQPRLSLDDANGTETLSVYSSKVGIGTVTFTDNYKTIIEGSDQETADLTDSGTHGATLFLRATGENVGSGGAVAFGTTNGNQRPFAAIKSYVNDGTANSVGDLAFSTRATTSATNLTERMRLTQSGRLVVGVNTPQGKLDVQSDGQYTPAAYFRNDGNATGWARADWFNDQASGTGIIYRDQAGSFVFRNDNSSGTAMTTRIVAGGTTAGNIVFNKDATGSGEVGRFDTSGNLLVGKTGLGVGTAGLELRNDGLLAATRSGSNVAVFRRLSSHGSIVDFQKDGTTVGSIGSNDNDPYIAKAGGNGFRWYSGAAVPTNDSGATADNVMDLGSSIGRFDDIYATNSTIQTSDRNEKQDIEELSDAEQRVAVACKGLLRKFRWKSSVEEKGDDARIHFGIIAQDLQDAFTAEGLDAGRYAMFTSATWTDEETGEERSRMGVRYSELLAFIISAI